MTKFIYSFTRTTGEEQKETPVKVANVDQRPLKYKSQQLHMISIGHNMRKISVKCLESALQIRWRLVQQKSFDLSIALQSICDSTCIDLAVVLNTAPQGTTGDGKRSHLWHVKIKYRKGLQEKLIQL